MGTNQPGGHNPWPLAHYQNVSENLRRYRDYRWKIPIWTAGFLLGLGAAGLKMPLDPWVRILAGLTAIGTAVLAIWNLHRCYDAYVNHRRCVETYESNRDGNWHDVPGTAPGVYDGCGRLWPGWPDVHNAHRVFRLGWFGLIIATVVFAVWAMCVDHRDSEPTPPAITNLDILPVAKTQVNIERDGPEAQRNSP